jgi:hypothetical protein
MLFKLFATTLFINRIQGFQFIKPLTAIQNHKHATTVKMILNEKDFSSELQFIQNSKFYQWTSTSTSTFYWNATNI